MIVSVYIVHAIQYFRTNPDMGKFTTNMGEKSGSTLSSFPIEDLSLRFFKGIWVVSWGAKDSGTRSDSRQLPSLFISKFLMLEIVQSLWRNVRSFVVKCSESFWMCLMFDVSFWIGGKRVECSWHFQLGYESCRIRPSSHEPWWHLLDCQHILKYETEETAEF